MHHQTSISSTSSILKNKNGASSKNQQLDNDLTWMNAPCIKESAEENVKRPQEATNNVEKYIVDAQQMVKELKNSQGSKEETNRNRRWRHEQKRGRQKMLETGD